MGRSNEASIIEAQEKQDQLEYLPEQVNELFDGVDSRITQLNEQLDQAQKLTEGIDKSIRESNSFKSKFKDHMVGGSVGAILGIVLTLAVSWVNDYKTNTNTAQTSEKPQPTPDKEKGKSELVSSNTANEAQIEMKKTDDEVAKGT
ncbi:hypothetical protein BJG01_09885 [Vibrio splendidus]|nr:hypothetical protein BJG01_09885 [Vibrio splendidus]URM14690.1 hypothetical protein KLJ63_03625 [Vibrio splendidus]